MKTSELQKTIEESIVTILSEAIYNDEETDGNVSSYYGKSLKGYNRDLKKAIKNSDDSQESKSFNKIPKNKINNILSISGKLIDEYPVDESQTVSNAGSATVYEYRGKKYEVIVWNQDAEEHYDGEITINVLSESKAVKLSEIQNIIQESISTVVKSMLIKEEFENTKFGEYLAKKKREYGDKFDSSALAKKFIPYYNSGERIAVDFGNGVVKRGRVGATTGWKPVFLLVLTTRSMGSSYTLSDKDEIVPITKQKRIQEVAGTIYGNKGTKVNKENSVDYIIQFEDGSLGANDILELFSYLLSTGLAWQLQGFYGRTASRLIEMGYITKDGTIKKFFEPDNAEEGDDNHIEEVGSSLDEYAEYDDEYVKYMTAQTEKPKKTSGNGVKEYAEYGDDYVQHMSSGNQDSYSSPKKKPLWAIFKKGKHVGNSAGSNRDEAIRQYVKDASLDYESVKSWYTATPAVKGKHHY